MSQPIIVKKGANFLVATRYWETCTEPLRVNGWHPLGTNRKPLLDAWLFRWKGMVCRVSASQVSEVPA